MSKGILYILALIALISVNPVNAQVSCLRAPNPVVIQGSINAGDVQQAGRITRDGQASSCGGDTAQLENNTALRRDTHNFVNPYNENVCVRVDVDFSGCGGNQTQAVAYSGYNPANPAANVIGDLGFSTINKGSFLFSVGPNANFSVVVNELEANTGCPLYGLKVTYLRNCRQAGFDHSNDGKADPTVYRPSSLSKWYTMDSETNQPFQRDFGTVGDLVTGGSDYTGDGRSDVSIYRPSTNTWFYGNNQNTPGSDFTATSWGIAGDRAVPGDYDGDGKNDVAIWRPTGGQFFVLRSGDGTLLTRQWGVSTDNPVVGDFDGDHLADFAIARPTFAGIFWWVLKSNFNYGFDDVIQWGTPGDKAVPADYDGDGRTDYAIWRASEGNFWIRQSSNLQTRVYKWGTNGDIPQPADYDGDNIVDLAIWRPSNGTWFILQSETDTVRYLTFGQQGDQPSTAPYRIQ
ncbi:MAG: VCBS repeat-containing protein [Pyrinomonadaceae bacterium]|nr:VCBS repeat-containing protein [Pyrinomonadaceae bacterium]